MDVCLKLVIQERNLRHKKILQAVWSSPSSLLSGIFLFYFFIFLSFVCWGGRGKTFEISGPPPSLRPCSSAPHALIISSIHMQHSSSAPYTCNTTHTHTTLLTQTRAQVKLLNLRSNKISLSNA